MAPIKAQKLSLGDTIGIIAPSSPPKSPARIDEAVEALEDLGFIVKLGKATRKRNGYLAGSDSERLEDIHVMFADPSVKGIIALRGGYGASRLLPKLRYDLIRKNPKIFCGFSDITSLHLAFLKKSGLMTFHGPHALSTFVGGKVDTSKTIVSFLRRVMRKEKGDLADGFSLKGVKTLKAGRSSGRLIGGNLSLICSLIGTPYLPSFQGSILFLEDVGEAHYRIDRYLTHLINSEVLKGVRGIVLGQWSECDNAKLKGAKQLRDIFIERLSRFSVPMLLDYPFGHVDNYCTIPYGARVELNATAKTVRLLEASVLD